MRALRLHTADGPAGLRLDDVPVPVAGAGEALVRVERAALTRDELDWPVDRLPAIPSYELCGVVVATGPGADPVLVGSTVLALTPFDRDGVAAEYAAVPAALLAPKPASLDNAQAAALPLPGLSAWQLLFDHGGMKHDEVTDGLRVLVLGAAGGVGQLVTQLARLHGAYVVGTASAPAYDLAVENGAHQVLDPADAAAMKDLEPVDLLVDTVGRDLLRRAIPLVRPGGRVVSVAEEPPSPDDDSVSTAYFVVVPDAEQLAELARLAGAGELRVAVDSVYELGAAQAAFTRVQSTGKRGKVVLQVRGA